MRTILLLAALTAGCVSSDSVECGDRVCPKGTTCIQLAASADDPHRCVDPDAVTACSSVPALEGCSYMDVANGACYATTDGEVCLAAGCGNGLVDKNEACDDGNANIGDGCSAACRSDETCGNGIVDPVTIDDMGNLAQNEVCDDGNDLGHDGCTSGCDAEAAAWTEVSPGLPSPRIETPMVYDPLRRRIILFAGATHDRASSCAEPPCPNPPYLPRGDTWESDGVAWHLVAPRTSPSARSGAAMAFDIAHRVTVMFGGDDGVIENDTWTFDGQVWTPLSPATSPPARHRHGIAYDARRKVVVLFGGRDASDALLADTWEWDGKTWTQVTPAGSITAQEAMAMTYDPARGVVVMIGFDASGTYTTWEYDGTSWSSKAGNDVTPQASSIAFDRVSRRVVTFAYQANSGNGTYAWDGSAWTVVAGTDPSPLVFATSFVSTPDGHVMLFGGERITCGGIGNCFVNATSENFTWDGANWTPLPVVAPALRRGARAALDSAHGTIVMVGGTVPDSTSGAEVPYQETWEYDGGHWTLFDGQPWTLGTSDPAMAYDSARDEMVVYGGFDTQANAKSETWIRHNRIWTNANQSTPGAIEYAAMAYDPVRKRVVMFGGDDATAGTAGGLGTTWLWDGATWTAASPPGMLPSPRTRAAMSWDPIGQQIVMFGGQSYSYLPYLHDTWTWDGTQWSEHVTNSGPSGRIDSQLAWDGARHALVLFGGVNTNGTATNDSWEWSAGTWRAIDAASPPAARSDAAQASLPDGSGIFVFGGYGNPDMGIRPHYADAFQLRWQAPLPDELCSRQVDDDGDGKTGCDDPDCWPRCTPACPPGAPCDATAPHCGDGVCNAALEDCRTCPGDCAATTCTSSCGDAICDPTETAAACPGDCTP